MSNLAAWKKLINYIRADFSPSDKQYVYGEKDTYDNARRFLTNFLDGYHRGKGLNLLEKLDYPLEWREAWRRDYPPGLKLGIREADPYSTLGRILSAVPPEPLRINDDFFQIAQREASGLPTSLSRVMWELERGPNRTLETDGAKNLLRGLAALREGAADPTFINPPDLASPMFLALQDRLRRLTDPQFFQSKLDMINHGIELDDMPVFSNYDVELD